MTENLPKETEEKALAQMGEKQKEITPMMNPQDEMLKLIPTAGTIALDDNQRKILYAPVKEEDVEIRPDGLVYLPWMEYVERLKGAFGLSWAIIPQGLPKMSGNYMYWPFWLVIQGKIAGFAIGEQQYIPSNKRMTYGDAVEGAKSNALMRLCKGIGISLELWKPSFVREWKAKHAEEVMDEKSNDMIWRKKTNGEDGKDRGSMGVYKQKG